VEGGWVPVVRVDVKPRPGGLFQKSNGIFSGCGTLHQLAADARHPDSSELRNAFNRCEPNRSNKEEATSVDGVNGYRRHDVVEKLNVKGNVNVDVPGAPGANVGGKASLDLTFEKSKAFFWLCRTPILTFSYKPEELHYVYKTAYRLMKPGQYLVESCAICKSWIGFLAETENSTVTLDLEAEGKIDGNADLEVIRGKADLSISLRTKKGGVEHFRPKKEHGDVSCYRLLKRTYWWNKKGRFPVLPWQPKPTAKLTAYNELNEKARSKTIEADATFKRKLIDSYTERERKRARTNKAKLALFKSITGQSPPNLHSEEVLGTLKLCALDGLDGVQLATLKEQHSLEGLPAELQVESDHVIGEAFRFHTLKEEIGTKALSAEEKITKFEDAVISGVSAWIPAEETSPLMSELEETRVRLEVQKIAGSREKQLRDAVRNIQEVVADALDEGKIEPRKQDLFDKSVKLLQEATEFTETEDFTKLEAVISAAKSSKHDAMMLLEKHFPGWKDD